MDQFLLDLAANAPIYVGLVALIAEVRNSRDDWRSRYDRLLDYVLEETDLTPQQVYKALNGETSK